MILRCVRAWPRPAAGAARRSFSSYGAPRRSGGGPRRQQGSRRNGGDDYGDGYGSAATVGYHPDNSMTRKQMQEVEYFRSLVVRMRRERERHRKGRRDRLRPADAKRAQFALYGKPGGDSTGINFGDYDNIPVERRGCPEAEVPACTSFSEMEGLPEFLMRNVERCSYDVPTPVQKHAMPLGMAGRDVMACSQTGSGKTCAFLLPAVAKLGSEEAGGFDEEAGVAAPRAVILAPTRELALQTQKELQKLCFEGCVIHVCSASLLR